LLGLCERFSTISALELSENENLETDTIMLMAVLQRLGPRLRSLTLKETNMLSLRQVLEHCPHLKRFKFSNCCFNNEVSDKWPERFLNCLEEASLVDKENRKK
jgi:hypothetical protein